MKGFYTIILLIFSNIFMTFAWYGHLKLQEMKVTTHWPLIAIILLSWGMAFFEYTLQVLSPYSNSKSYRRSSPWLSLPYLPLSSSKAKASVGTISPPPYALSLPSISSL